MPTIDTETVKEPQSTAVKADTNTEPQTPAVKDDGSDTAAEERPRLKDQPIEQQLEVTRELMRKHEKQSRENYRLYEQAQSQLAEANTRIALFELRRDHPTFTDEDVADCKETDPEAIKRWGDTLQAALDRHGPARQEPATERPLTTSTPDLARAMQGMNAMSSPKTDGDSPEALRKRYRDKYKRRNDK